MIDGVVVLEEEGRWFVEWDNVNDLIWGGIGEWVDFEKEWGRGDREFLR